MCVSCDCGEHHDGHGDSRHITIEMLWEAAAAGGISIDQVANNIRDAVKAQEHK